PRAISQLLRRWFSRILVCSLYGSRKSSSCHTFPTRRSSDLARGLRGIIEKIMLPLQFDLPSKPNIARCIITQKFIDQEESVTLEDRKSTRLNSSHVKISYAVFCLKKKMMREPRNKHKRLSQE